MRPGSIGKGDRSKWNTAGVLLDTAALSRPVDFVEVFGNARPVEIEIGCGKGTFLLAYGAARPEVNILGIEYAAAYAAYCADRVRRAGLSNVRLIHTEALTFFKTSLAPASVQRVHVYFPDPWPKRRHHRRRLIQPSFVGLVRRALRPGGQMLIATDHFEYARHIRRVLHDVPGFVRIPLPRLVEAEGLVGTNFERKFRAHGRPTYALGLMRYV